MPSGVPAGINGATLALAAFSEVECKADHSAVVHGAGAFLPEPPSAAAAFPLLLPFPCCFGAGPVAAVAMDPSWGKAVSTSRHHLLRNFS